MRQENKIIPVILAGGNGTRLWPLSRQAMPKQFARLGNNLSLFQETLERVMDGSLYSTPIIVGNAAHASIINTQLAEVGVSDAIVICEPQGRDTAAAIALAAELCPQNDAPMLVLPSDHRIVDVATFNMAVENAARVTRWHRQIFTFGIYPDHAETGFGYLRAGESLGDGECRSLNCFIEKPDNETATRLIRENGVYWNAGIFLFRKDRLIQEFEKHAVVLLADVRLSIERGQWSGNRFDPDSEAFNAIKPISFDYAIMEKTENAAVMPVDPKWSDLGSWKAYWEVAQRDCNENHIDGNVFETDSRNCLAITDGPVVGIAGLEDVVVVANRDAILVTSRTNPQGVKHIVEQMKDSGIPAAMSHAGEKRPWGSFESLDRGARHQVKRITVASGGRLSLQYHHHRAEHWVVVAGLATVTVDSSVMLLGPCQQVFIPQGSVHRLENLTEEPVEIIEVQYGNYLGEDDIVRVEDIYGRDPVEKPANITQVA